MTEINQQQYTQQSTSDTRLQADKELDSNQRPKKKITKPSISRILYEKGAELAASQWL